MAEDEEDKILYHEDYMEKAKKLHDISDLEERVREAVKLGREYKGSDMVISGLREEFITAFDFVKLGELQKKIHDAHKEKKKTLSDIEAEELLKDTLLEILPKIKYGTADRETNFHAFGGYMSMMDNDKYHPLDDILDAIKKGDGRAAVNKIIDSMAAFKMGKAERAFNKYLLPSDHLEFREALSKYMTKEVNKYTKGNKELDIGKVSKSPDYAFRNFINGEYGEMLKRYGTTTDQTKKSE